MESKFSSHMRQDGSYTIIPKEEPGRRDEDYIGTFSYNMGHAPLKKGRDKKESRELMCPI